MKKHFKFPSDVKAFRESLKNQEYPDGMSQRAFAEFCSKFRGAPVTQPQICAWENGEDMSRATRAMFERMAESMTDSDSPTT